MSGPVIGFYGLDFFPFNSYELYRYMWHSIRKRICGIFV
jgi:hypothetical protein